MMYYVFRPRSDNQFSPRHGNSKYPPIPLSCPTKNCKHNGRKQRQTKSRGSLWIKVIQQDSLQLTDTSKIRQIMFLDHEIRKEKYYKYGDARQEWMKL